MSTRIWDSCHMRDRQLAISVQSSGTQGFVDGTTGTVQFSCNCCRPHATSIRKQETGNIWVTPLGNIATNHLALTCGVCGHTSLVSVLSLIHKLNAVAGQRCARESLLELRSPWMRWCPKPDVATARPRARLHMSSHMLVAQGMRFLVLNSTTKP